MIQNIKSILIGLTKEFGPEESSSAIGYGLSLAREAGADLTVQAVSTRLVVASAWIGGFASGLIDAENRRLRELAEAAARTARIDAAAAGITCVTHAPHLTYPDLLRSFSSQARVHDLVVVDAESEALHPDRGLIEHLLTASGRPLFIVPAGYDTFRGRRIIVAWDGSASAARACSDALPFLRGAEAVQVITVTGEKELPEGTGTTAVTQNLARHGVAAAGHSIPARNGDAAEALREAAEEFGADMIVMGGFVHARLREMVLGGVTQSLLGRSMLPLLMSH